MEPTPCEERTARLIVEPLDGQKESVTYQVEAHLFAACELEATSLFSKLEAGDCPDLELLTRTFGTAIEFVLSDLFRQHEDTVQYWVDGVIVDSVTLQPGRVVVAKGRAWCADYREQWQIPSEIECRFSDSQDSTLSSVAIRVGNAALATLGDHRNRSITKTGEPRNWLLEFEVSR